MNEMLGKRIRELRNAAGLTQEEIAGQLGISRQKYARIENGFNNITFDILSRISDILGVTVADITKILDESVVVEHRSGEEVASSDDIFNMLDLFYANKHMYLKLQH